MQRIIDAFPTMPYPVVEAIYHMMLLSKEELPSSFSEEQKKEIVKSLTELDIKVLEEGLMGTSLCKSKEDAKAFAKIIKDYFKDETIEDKSDDDNDNDKSDDKSKKTKAKSTDSK